MSFRIPSNFSISFANLSAPTCPYARLPLPPGPKPVPILGNAPQFPQDRWYETFSEWTKTYGDMIYMNVLGNKMVIVNSLDVARDLLEKRGQNYSNRVWDGIHCIVMGWGWNVVISQPGPFHSECRTIFKRAIGPNEVVKWDPLIHEEAKNLLDGLEKVRGDPWDVIQARIGAIVIRLTYGDSIYRAHGDELVQLNAETLELVTWVGTQFWLVNFIHSLHYLPDWLPLPFKKIGKKGLELQERMHYWPWGQTVKHYKEGIAEPSVTLDYLEDPSSVSSLDVVRDALGMTASTFASFISMMLLNPHVQKKIHVELDQFGAHTFTFEDRPDLPYLDAAWKESMRLNPSSPLGVPHQSAADDMYKGMYLPKDTMFMTNIGYMARDPRIWDEPDTYKPERWLKEYNPKADSLPSIYDIVFGFGRRLCPGQFLADRVGFIFAAAVLKTYDILPIEGETLPKEFVYQDAVTRRPEGVRCRFVRRSKY
ncbi:cytochrome P450 [Serendipita vermifera]|nr:cytochrome P450 [Serendipita vermifera]